MAGTKLVKIQLLSDLILQTDTYELDIWVWYTAMKENQVHGLPYTFRTHQGMFNSSRLVSLARDMVFETFWFGKQTMISEMRHNSYPGPTKNLGDAQKAKHSKFSLIGRGLKKKRTLTS